VKAEDEMKHISEILDEFYKNLIIKNLER